jgi:type VI secretion system protein ImpA
MLWSEASRASVGPASKRSHSATQADNAPTSSGLPHPGFNQPCSPSLTGSFPPQVISTSLLKKRRLLTTGQTHPQMPLRLGYRHVRMAVLDIGKLLAPVAPDAPAGPNLEYDPAFGALERAAAGKPEQVIGGAVTPEEPPDWNSVLSGSLELLGRTKDLRVAVLAARALLHRNGVAAFAEGLALLRGLVEQHWPSLHPQLDPDDNNDPTMRVTALASLATSGLVMALRRSALIDSRALGPVSFADMFPATGSADSARISGVFESVELPVLEETIAALATAAADLHAIDAVFEAQTGNRGPDFAVLLDYFNKGHLALRPRLEARKPVEVAAEASPDGSSVRSPASPPPPRGLTGDILTREDVVKALDKICEYYARHEPASPVPVMAQRCKKLVTMSFFEILNELAPDGVKQAQVVMGKEDGK